MRTDKDGFKLEPGAADGLGIGMDRFGEYSTNSARPDVLAGVSQSGQERNHLFLNQRDGQFADISGIAGVDSPEDGRSFATLDYDQDGWLDMVVVNSNAPTTLLYRNRMGALSGGAATNGVIAMRFVGAHDGSGPTSGKTPRDGYGAQVVVGLGDAELLREYRCGEGLAAQNSSTLLIGLGEHERVESLSVRWPSGLVFERDGVPAGALIVAYEDAAQSPTGESFVISEYGSETVATSPSGGSVVGSAAAGAERLSVTESRPAEERAELVLYTTMATWCASCRAELPELEHLRAAFAPEELQMYGVPIDEKESVEELRAYVATAAPAYELLLDLSEEQVAEVELHANRASVLEDALPVTVLTDAEGNVLLTRLGAPSVSELRRILYERRAL